MLIEAYLDALVDLPFASLEQLAGTGPIVILSPHPDDETLGCGGLIAAARRSGRTVVVVTVTDGSGSHPASKSHPPAVLARVRREETRRAAAILGVGSDNLIALDLKDTAVPLHGAVFDAAVDRIAAIILDYRAENLFVTSGLDPHGDHVSAAAMAQSVARRKGGLALWFYPIWSWHLPREDVVKTRQPTGFRLDIAPFVEAKHAAIACHASQMTELIDDDPGAFRFTAATLAPFLRPFEVFIEAMP